MSTPSPAPFGWTHAEYAAARSTTGGRNGHLQQNRFFSCPLDAARLENAMGYVGNHVAPDGAILGR
jgi:hypothetical protein